MLLLMLCYGIVVASTTWTTILCTSMCYERYVDEGYDAKLGFLWKSVVLFVSISYCLANWFYIKLMFCWNLWKTWISMRFVSIVVLVTRFIWFFEMLFWRLETSSHYIDLCVSIRKLLLHRFMCVSSYSVDSCVLSSYYIDSCVFWFASGEVNNSSIP